MVLSVMLDGRKKSTRRVAENQGAAHFSMPSLLPIYQPLAQCVTFDSLLPPPPRHFFFASLCFVRLVGTWFISCRDYIIKLTDI